MARKTALRLALLAGAAVQQGSADALLEGFRTLDYRASSFQNSQVRSLSHQLPSAMHTHAGAPPTG